MDDHIFFVGAVFWVVRFVGSLLRGRRMNHVTVHLVVVEAPDRISDFRCGTFNSLKTMS